MAGIAAAQVSALIATLNGWASSALASAEAALAALAGIDYPYVSGVCSNIGTFTPAPLSLPSPPSPLTISVPPPIPAITIPTKPTPPSTSLPTAPSLPSLVVPSKPSISIPTMDSVFQPVIRDITLPSIPLIPDIDIIIDPPTPITITPQPWSFNIDNILISDDPMVLAIMNRIRNNITYGGSGLIPEIEDAIWQRDLERNEQQLIDSTDKIAAMWAKKGFSLPDGLLAHSLSEVQKEYMNRRVDRSREISIKQAELEQNNLFKSMELGVNLAFKLVEALTAHEELIFRTQDATAKYANEYIDLQIRIHMSNVETYRAVVQMHELKIRANLAKVEIYKAQIDGELAKVGINEAMVRLYSAQITAAVEKYKGTLEAGHLHAQIFTTEVQAVLAQAQISESLVKAYAEQVRAVMAGVEIYKAETEGMMAELGVQKAVVDANVAQVTAWGKGIDAQIANLTAQVEVYRAQGTMNVAVAEMADKAAEVILRAQIEAAKVAVSAADVVARSIASKANAMVEAAKGVAAATASLAAGAMAAAHAQASMSYQEYQPLQETGG